MDGAINLSILMGDEIWEGMGKKWPGLGSEEPEGLCLAAIRGKPFWVGGAAWTEGGRSASLVGWGAAQLEAGEPGKNPDSSSDSV